MNRKKKIIIIIPSVFAVMVVGGLLYAQFMLTHQLPDAGNQFELTDSVKKVIRENVENGKHQALFVGIINGEDVNYYYYGDTAKDENPIDENTIFEIGSVTKVFTTLILAEMAEKGELSLDDPIDKFLPEHIVTPSKNGKKITILDLATHTSGLPRFPDDFPILDSDAMQEYDREKIYNYLSRVKIHRDIGSQYEYSNIGVSLLGHVISLQAGQSYEELVKTRISDKFGMENTCIKQCDKQRDQFAKPHSFGNQVDELNLSEDMVGAGEIRSSGKDMLAFLSYAMGLKESSLKSSFELAQTANHKIDDLLSVGLAWHITQDEDGRKIIWHNGATNGFASIIGFDPESNQGVVVLTNSMIPVDDIAVWLFQHGHMST